MSSLLEKKKEFNKKISKNLNYLMKRDGYSQNHLRRVMEEHDLEINQGTISKYVNGSEGNYCSIPFLIKCCEIFDVSLEELVTQDLQEVARGKGNKLSINNLKSNFDLAQEGLITDINHQAFNGYVGTYYCYLYPTISSEKNVLTGIMKISDDSADYTVSVELNVPSKQDPAARSFCKNYEGSLIVSNRLQSCYCILKSNKLSEICFLAFRHIYLNKTPLDCRMAEVLTVSAGESHYPTVHRMFFSRQQLKEEDLKLILPMLNMNCSDIILSEEDMESLEKEELIPQEILEQLKKQITPKSVYEFKENLIRSITELVDDKKKIPEYISVIRDKALKNRYNKVSKKLDDTVRQLLISRGYYKDQKE